MFDGESKPLLDSVRKALEAQNVTHLLVVARSRGEAAFPVEQGHIGIGSVEGLGYYIDKVTQIKNTDVGMSDRGYLAPFTYYRLMLFEFARAAVVGEERVAASMLHPIAGSGETDPWELVSSQQKFDDIDVLLKKHMGAALARLRARARP